MSLYSVGMTFRVCALLSLMHSCMVWLSSWIALCWAITVAILILLILEAAWLWTKKDWILCWHKFSKFKVTTRKFTTFLLHWVVSSRSCSKQFTKILFIYLFIYLFIFWDWSTSVLKNCIHHHGIKWDSFFYIFQIIFVVGRWWQSRIPLSVKDLSEKSDEFFVRWPKYFSTNN